MVRSQNHRVSVVHHQVNSLALPGLHRAFALNIQHMYNIVHMNYEETSGPDKNPMTF